MHRALKRSGLILAAMGLMIVALCGALWVAGNTASGRTLIERLTYRLTAGQVKLIGLGGSFPAELTLGDLELRDAGGVWLTAHGLSLHWSPFMLVERRIEVDELQLQRLHMERAPIANPRSGSVHIPHIDVGQFSVGTVELGAPLVGTPAALSIRGKLELRSLQDAHVDGVARRLDGDGDYILHVKLDPKRMDASLALHEPAGGPLEHLLSLPGLGALSASLTLAGPRDAARVELALQAGDLRGQVQGSVDMRHASADLDYSVAATSMTVRPDLAWSRVALTGNWHGSLATPLADARLEIEGLRMAGNTQLRQLNAVLSASGGKVAVNSVITGLEIPGPRPRLLADAPLRIAGSIVLNEASRPLEVTVVHPLFTMHAHTDTATMNAGRLHAALVLNVPEVAPFAAIVAQDVRGTAAIHAHLALGSDASTVDLNALVGLTGGAAPWIGIAGPRVALQLSASLGDDSVRIQSARLAGHAATLIASGSAARIAPSGRRGNSSVGSFIKDVQARWQLEIPDLTELSSDAAGDLKMTGRLSGSPTAMVADAEVTSRLSVRGSASGVVVATLHAQGLPNLTSAALQTNGTLDGAPLNVDAAIERGARDMFRLLIRQGDWKSVHVDGDLTSDVAMTQSHGQLRLHIGQLSDLDRLSGVHVAGAVEGSVGFVPAGGHTQAHVELHGSNLLIGPFAGNLNLQGTGVSDALDMQLTAQLPNLYGLPAKASSAATLNIDTRKLRIENFSVDYRGETFRLLSPAELSFVTGVSVDEFKMGAQRAVFDLKGQLAPTFDLRASLVQVDSGLMNVFMPGLFAGGTLAAQTQLHGSPSSLAGEVRVDAGDVRFADDAATGLSALEFHAQAQIADNSALLKGTLTAGSGSQVTVSGAAPINESGAFDMTIGGNLDVGLANPFLEARGLRAVGQLSIDATVTGSASAPLVGGVITLGHGSLRDYGRGVNLSDIKAEVVGIAGGLRIKSFNATAISGTVTMAGTFGVLQPGMPVDLKITAKNAQPLASNILTATLDADLHLTGTARERIDAAGTIHVIRAKIGIPNSLPPDVAVLDVRRRGQTLKLRGKQLVVGLDVLIQAPQEIIVQGRGLDAELGGETHLTGTSDEPLASGGFDLQRGSFTLAGNKLNFTQGRVSFDGAGLRRKIDPTLDFTAQTTFADSTTATLRITGLADAPRFEFSSTPALQQDEIMARLLFGENVAQLTAFQVAEIGAALATLSGVGGSGLNPLVKLQKTLGLDRLSVGASTTTTATGAAETSGAAIQAGRYISKRVYIEAKQSTTGNSQVQVDVDLSKHLKLQTRLGNGTVITQGTTPENDPGSSVGLSYQFEY